LHDFSLVFGKSQNTPFDGPTRPSQAAALVELSNDKRVTELAFSHLILVDPIRV
jgi:hypothetical protein